MLFSTKQSTFEFYVVKRADYNLLWLTIVKEVETSHTASTHGCAGFRPYEAGLHGLRGRQLICAKYKGL